MRSKFKIGDMLNCIKTKKKKYFTVGKNYMVMEFNKMLEPVLIADDKIKTEIGFGTFKKIAKPTQYDRLKLKGVIK